MTIEIVTDGVWTRLKSVQRRSRQRAWVAVAYFGKGAAQLLELNRGSHLVVDASEQAVKSGQTCPRDLLILLRKGVRIFSYPLLHAKVYVFGTTAAIGSANASRHSADVLFEAMIVTTEAKAVRQAKEFVRSIAKNEVGPEELRRLNRKYRQPHFPPGVGRLKPAPRKASSTRSFPRIRILHLSPVQWSDRDESERGAGEQVAARRRMHRSTWKMDDFQWVGAQNFRRGDKVVMVTREDSGARLVDPPGTVLHVRTYPFRNGTASFVYLELPPHRRKNIKIIARRLGRGSLRRLQRGGILSAEMSSKVYDLWQS
jgi:hypothetical protein